jgi:hypothetical protein
LAARRTAVSGRSSDRRSAGPLAVRSRSKAGWASPELDRRGALMREVASRRVLAPYRLLASCSSANGAFSP